ncbi:MAG: hypothetical protein M9893_11765 [Pyrinomonadaceae bacterium]|nr:hypothetical protein [Pyrinomonadaceae bacterium]
MGHTAGMHTQDRNAAIEFRLKDARSAYDHQLANDARSDRLETDLSPSMTLGCGSWGGNVTDNVSPLHLIDLKRVAFGDATYKQLCPIERDGVIIPLSAPAERPKVTREDIAAIVDSFLSKYIDAQPKPAFTRSGAAADHRTSCLSANCVRGR